MLNIYSSIQQAVVACIAQSFHQEVSLEQVTLQPTKKDFEGDVTVVVFPFVKSLKKSPQEITTALGDYLVNHINKITAYNAVGGFLNLSIADSYWLNHFNTALNATKFGFAKENSSKQTYIVEYSSPNTNKPLHLGHCRNIFLGYSVSEILKASGHQVIKTQIINDRGIHICKSMLAWQKFGNGETPVNAGLKGDKLVGKYYVRFDKEYKKQIDELVSKGVDAEQAKKDAPIIQEAQEMLVKWEQGDEEVVALWKKMNGWVYDGFDKTYQRMGVDFDELYYESETYLKGKEVVQEGLQKEVFYKKDNAVWVDLTNEGLDEKLLLRADGTSVYITQDIGTAILRYEKHPNVTGMIYTVGNEQDYHFDVLFKVLKKLGYSWAENCYHLSYGMVDLPTGRMKSREGTVVDADDLMNEVVESAKQSTQERGHIEGMNEAQKNDLYETIGLGGLRYFLLKIEPKKRMQFNPEESIDLNGNTAPFIQYGYARIQSILRKVEVPKSIKQDVAVSSLEKELVKLLLSYPQELTNAAKEYSPAVLCNFNYELIKLYNSFYQSHPILGEENEALKEFRIALSFAVAELTKNNMKLLGINVPEKM
ncbi:MAG: arginine--tRNA ligase [Bacteroidia bacterium]